MRISSIFLRVWPLFQFFSIPLCHSSLHSTLWWRSRSSSFYNWIKMHHHLLSTCSASYLTGTHFLFTLKRVWRRWFCTFLSAKMETVATMTSTSMPSKEGAVFYRWQIDLFSKRGVLISTKIWKCLIGFDADLTLDNFFVIRMGSIHSKSKTRKKANIFHLLFCNKNRESLSNNAPSIVTLIGLWSTFFALFLIDRHGKLHCTYYLHYLSFQKKN